MPLDLASVRAKLQRAEELANSVHGEIAAWMNLGLYSISIQAKADLTHNSFVFRVSELPPFDRWTLVIGDCIHNLRSALDHLIYAIAIHESRQNPPPNESRLAFLISDFPKEFDERRKRMKATLSDPVWAAIETVQPYNRGHEHLPPLLALLRDFNNTDKHKLLRLVFTAIHEADIGLTWEGPSSLVRIEFNTGELKDGTNVATIIFDSPAFNVQYNQATFTLIVAIPHKPGPDGVVRNDFLVLLQLMTAEVKSVVDMISAKVEV